MIFIYCGGKCGGSTLRETLKNLDEVCHIHNNEYYKTLHDDRNINIFDMIDFYSKNNSVYIIDVFRNPVDRKISSFFQNISYHLGNDWEKLPIDNLLNHFKKEYENLENYEAIDEVFDHYKLGDPPKKIHEVPYFIKQEGNLILVKLRFDYIDKWEEHLTEIFKQPIKIIKDNLTQDKEIYPLYKIFKQAYFSLI
tara:strand:+ start:202 stop:786 length:585 start_codon:yes stop_codon:yes gene_type:complete